MPSSAPSSPAPTSRPQDIQPLDSPTTDNRNSPHEQADNHNSLHTLADDRDPPDEPANDRDPPDEPADDHDSPDEPAIIHSSVLVTESLAMTTVTHSDPPAPASDGVTVPNKTSAKQGKDKASAQSKKLPKGKRFRPSQAKSARCAPWHNPVPFLLMCSLHQGV